MIRTRLRISSDYLKAPTLWERLVLIDDRQSKKFSSTDDRFLWTVGICALNNLSTCGTEKDPISTEILD